LCSGPQVRSGPCWGLTSIAVDLHDGWSCSFHFKKTANNRYAGVAAITLRGLQKGELVIMQQPSLEAAIARVKLRASQFVSARIPVVHIKGWRQVTREAAGRLARSVSP
jgi:hypothetical protein